MNKERLLGTISAIAILSLCSVAISVYPESATLPGDTDGDGFVSDEELLAYIDRWSRAEEGVDDLSVLQAIDNNAVHNTLVCEWWPSSTCRRMWTGKTANISWTLEEQLMALDPDGARAFARDRVIPVLKKCRPRDYEWYFACKCQPCYADQWRTDFSERIAMEVWYHATYAYFDPSLGVLGFNEWLISKDCTPDY